MLDELIKQVLATMMTVSVAANDEPEPNKGIVDETTRYSYVTSSDRQSSSKDPLILLSSKCSKNSDEIMFNAHLEGVRRQLENDQDMEHSGDQNQFQYSDD